MARGKTNKITKYTYEESHKEIKGIVYKLCSIHDEFCPKENPWLPCSEDYFYKNKSSPDGLYTYCKKCTSLKAKIWNNDNKDKARASRRKYKSKPYRKKIQAKWNKQVRESGYFKIYQKENKEKMCLYNNCRLHKNHKISKEEWESCLIYFNFSCAYCGISQDEAKAKYNQYLHKEHVVYNGENDLSNCVPSCKSCNSQKHTMNLDEWYIEENPKFLKDRLHKIYKWLNEDYKLHIKSNNQDILKGCD